MTAGDDTKAWVADVFDRAAPTYDRVGDSYHDEFGARLVEVAGIVPGTAVLDVGCGRGAALLPAAIRSGSSGRVIGVDISPHMIDAARSALSDAQLPNGAAHVMDAEELHFEDMSFDVVLCAFGVFFFPAPERAVAEFSRVLRPGGVAGVSTWTGEDQHWAWQDELLAEIKVPRRAITRPFDTPDDVARLLAGARFTEIRHHLEHRTIWFTTQQQWWDWMWSFSVRGVLEQLDEASREEFKRVCFTRMQPLREAAGFPMNLTACFTTARKPE